MSESPTPAAEAPAPTTGGQPEATQQQQTSNQPAQQTPSAPDVSEKINRLTSQINGMKALVEPLTRAGIRSADDLESLLEERSTLQEFQRRGVNVRSLLNGEAPKQQTEDSDEKPLTRSDLQTFFQHQRLEQEHEQADAKATQSLRQFATEIGGADYANDMWDIVLAEAGRHLQENGRRYDQSHPKYATSYVPPSEQDIEQIKQMVKQRLDRIRGATARQRVDDSVTQQAVPGGNPNTGVQEAPVNRKVQRQNRIRELLEQNQRMISGESVSNQ